MLTLTHFVQGLKLSHSSTIVSACECYFPYHVKAQYLMSHADTILMSHKSIETERTKIYKHTHTRWPISMKCNLCFLNIMPIPKRSNCILILGVTIAHICQLRHPRCGCTFFKPVYFFPQGTRKGLLWAKFIQTKYNCNSCYLCDEDNSSKISNAPSHVTNTSSHTQKTSNTPSR